MNERPTREPPLANVFRADVFRAGATAWSIYLVVECLLAVLVPWIVREGHAYRPLHWGATALLLLVYPVLGGVLAVLVGAALRGAGARGAPSGGIGGEDTAGLAGNAASLSLVLAFVAGWLTRIPLNLASVPPLALSLLLSGMTAWSAFEPSRFERFRFAIRPLAVSLLLFGQPWMVEELFFKASIPVKSAVSLVYWLAVLVALAAFSAGRSKSLSGWRLAVTVTVVVGVCALPDQSPLERSARPGPPRRAELANVILITLDTVRADHLSLYGYERKTTPHLEAFARDATLYGHAISTSDMTLASHASLFAGLYPRQHGAHASPENRLGSNLAEALPTLAEILFAAGYETRAVVANSPMLGHRYGLDQGFRYLDARVPVPFLGQTYHFLLRSALRDAVARCLPAAASGIVYRQAEEINREVFDVLEELKTAGRPFFLFANYMDAHWPTVPPPPYDTLFPGKDERFGIERYFDLKAEVLKLRRGVSGIERRHLESQYDGALAYLDANLGHLFTRLRQLGLYEDTLLVVTADHGEAFGDRGLISHGVSVYEDQVHVPLVVKYPGPPAREVVSRVVSGVDVLPTVLAVLRLGTPQGLVGRSLAGRSLFPSVPDEERFVVAESFPEPYLLDYHARFDRIERALYSGPYKLIRSTSGAEELYDVEQDPREENDLAGKSELSSRIGSLLETWLESTRETSSSPVELDSGTLEALKALGYVGQVRSR